MAFATLLLAGCSSVELAPNSAANEKARASIEAGGGEAADWRVVNGCAAMGPCVVELSPAERPGLVLARNRYRVKDSFPWPLGYDEIRATVARVERERCLERFGAAAPLARCAAGR